MFTPVFTSPRRVARPSLRPAGRFTLIELLVVVTIITILAAMLLPVLNRARGVAQRTSCVNNHKQIGIAYMMYADENDDSYPYTSYPATNVSWTVSVKPYLNDLRFYHCPSDEGQRWLAPVAPPTSNYYTTSYIMSAWIAATQVYGKMRNIRNPSAMIILVDANTDQTQRDHFHPFYWVNDPDNTYSSYMHSITWNDTTNATQEIDLDRHLGRFGAMYADGHVGDVAWSEVWWQDTSRGVLEGNFDPRQ